MGCSTSTILFTTGRSLVFSWCWWVEMRRRDRLGDKVLGSRGTKMDGKMDPSIPILTLKIKMGLMSRAPRFNKFLYCG